MRRFGFAQDAAQQGEHLPIAAHLFKLIQHENVRLPPERFCRIDQFFERGRFRRALRPFFPNSAQQTFVGFGGHGFPVMKDRAVAQNVFQPRTQQRCFASARSSTNDDQQDLIVQRQPQQLLQFAFAAKLAEEFAVGFGEGHWAFDRGRTILFRRQLRRVRQSPDANESIHERDNADGIKRDLRPSEPFGVRFEFRNQLAADRKASRKTSCCNDKRSLFALAPFQRANGVFDELFELLPSKHLSSLG
ncbi:MAG: hypothetical protein SF097_12110 [Acidobacteriota bacterium]|nr:hypothetical protein [Acidobacteriota bacterium]